MKLSWSKVYGSQGYNVYMTTNPSGKWYNMKKTTSAGSTVAKIKKYNGSKFKTYKNYYYRIRARLSLGNGKYKESPLPSSSFYCGSFYFGYK